MMKMVNHKSIKVNILLAYFRETIRMGRHNRLILCFAICVLSLAQGFRPSPHHSIGRPPRPSTWTMSSPVLRRGSAAVLIKALPTAYNRVDIPGYKIRPKDSLSVTKLGSSRLSMNTRLYFFGASSDDLPSLSGPTTVPSVIQDINVAVVKGFKGLMDVFFEGRDYARFYALETIARVPYFAYTCVLHLYETLGWFRKAEYLRLHFAQDWNEYHHLKIAEFLGGNRAFMDRLIAQSVSVIYFVLSALLYMLSPAIAYNLSQQVERFAYLSYDKFLKRRETELKSIPAPPVAIDFYGQPDPLVPVNASSISAAKEAVLPGNDAAMAAHLRSGPPKTLYDTFVRVRDDELDHAVTMKAMEGLIAKGDL